MDAILIWAMTISKWTCACWLWPHWMTSAVEQWAVKCLTTEGCLWATTALLSSARWTQSHVALTSVDFGWICSWRIDQYLPLPALKDGKNENNFWSFSYVIIIIIYNQLAYCKPAELQYLISEWNSLLYVAAELPLITSASICLCHTELCLWQT